MNRRTFTKVAVAGLAAIAVPRSASAGKGWCKKTPFWRISNPNHPSGQQAAMVWFEVQFRDLEHLGKGHTVYFELGLPAGYRVIQEDSHPGPCRAVESITHVPSDGPLFLKCWVDNEVPILARVNVQAAQRGPFETGIHYFMSNEVCYIEYPNV